MNLVLEFERIERAYQKGARVLDGVTFSLAPGEVIGLLGRNGAGKTTLIRIAMGLLFPHAGSVRVFGLSPTKDAVAVKKRVGFVAEEQIFPLGAKVGELIALHRYVFGKWDDGLQQDLMERSSISPQSKMKQLSKGQARQVALFLAVCHRPDLLILDEPAAGLDPAAGREFLETAIHVLNREGTSLLFSSHNMNDVERIGERVVLLEQGKVRVDEEIDRLREDFCVAMIPLGSAATAIESAPGCLRVRPVMQEWHAVFEGPPDVVQAELKRALGSNGIRCVRMPLEELFIELVGSERWER